MPRSICLKILAVLHVEDTFIDQYGMVCRQKKKIYFDEITRMWQSCQLIHTIILMNSTSIDTLHTDEGYKTVIGYHYLHS